MKLAAMEEVLSKYVKHQTHPLAIKMLTREDQIPPDAKRPLKEYGAAFTLCQAIALSRKEGLTLVLDKETLSCPIALAGLGFVRPDEFLSGKYALVPTNQSEEARRRAAEAMPRFSFGEFRLIVIAPLARAVFDPDVVLFYGTGAQVMRMVQAAVFESGEALTSRSTGSGGCLLPVVVPALEDRCVFALPGNGERRLGLIADGELAFAMPGKRLEEVIQGLELSHAGRQTYPVSPGYLKMQCEMPAPYVKLREALLDSGK